MFCSFCKEEMSPLKGSICTSGINKCCAPYWCCHRCGNILFLKDEKEFDLWISEYTNGIYTDPDESLGLFNSLDLELLKKACND